MNSLIRVSHGIINASDDNRTIYRDKEAWMIKEKHREKETFTICVKKNDER